MCNLIVGLVILLILIVGAIVGLAPYLLVLGIKVGAIFAGGFFALILVGWASTMMAAYIRASFLPSTMSKWEKREKIAEAASVGGFFIALLILYLVGVVLCHFWWPFKESLLYAFFLLFLIWVLVGGPSGDWLTLGPFAGGESYQYYDIADKLVPNDEDSSKTE